MRHGSLLQGRSPVECYRDFMCSFRDACMPGFESTIEEVVVGCGPCGGAALPLLS